MQANGAEMLRIACILMTEVGIRVCAPVHDAVLIEAPLEELEARIQQAQELMRGFQTGTGRLCVDNRCGYLSLP